MAQLAISPVCNKAFRTYTTWSADGAERHALPFDYLGVNQVTTLEYSPSGNEADYYRLRLTTQLERRSDVGRPYQYMIEGEYVIINAYPSSGTFRMTYAKRFPRLEPRRATVSSHTKSSTALSALTLSTSSPFDNSWPS